MNRIKELRVSSGLKQGELAKTLGVKQNTLSTWETGRHEPDNEMLIRLADIFDVSVDYLLGNTTKKKPGTITGDGLTKEEVELLMRYRNASEEVRRVIDKIVKE